MKLPHCVKLNVGKVPKVVQEEINNGSMKICEIVEAGIQAVIVVLVMVCLRRTKAKVGIDTSDHKLRQRR